MMILFNLLCVFVLGNAQAAEPVRIRAIYGEDGRKELSEVQSPRLQEAARSVAAMVDASKLIWDDVTRTYAGSSRSIQSIYDLCQGERFNTQPGFSFCTSFLVDSNHVLTAGHCVDAGNCAQTLFVFDYNSESNLLFAEEQVFSCKRVVSRSMNDDLDFALVELDRATRTRLPLSLDRSKRIETGTAVQTLGYPLGIPIKAVESASVIDGKNGTWEPQSGFVVTNLDSFIGNSGSPVFNQSTGKVIGVLVRGETDFRLKYIEAERRFCRESVRCDASGKDCVGENVTRSSSILTRVGQ